AYTIDSPVKVARFGISSVISITEDRLIEMMRGHYYTSLGETWRRISTKEPDYRAKRITDYLNLVNRIVKEQMARLKRMSFTPGSDIARYFEMLPDNNPLKQLYAKMERATCTEEKEKMACRLRMGMQPGSID